MKKALIILFILSSFTCYCQVFTKYIGQFRKVGLPVKINRKTGIRIFTLDSSNRNIPASYIKKYICKSTSKCDSDPARYVYNYGIRFDYAKNFYTVLLRKQKYEGITPYDFDLSEVILVVYKTDGTMVSQMSIGKNNDGWMSDIDITREKIKVKQIKILEFNKPSLSCEIRNIKYKINSDGIIEADTTEPVKKGAVAWNDEIQDFILK